MAKADQIQAAIRLAELRKQQGITQAQLAERLGVSQASISQVENQAE
ncbi:MAG: helix-turn-helix transcriptional regulator [Moraxellaceae bacterium]